MTDDIRELVEGGAISGIPDTLRALRKARMWCLTCDAALERLLGDPTPAYEDLRLLGARLAEGELDNDVLNRIREAVVDVERRLRERRPSPRLVSVLREALKLLPSDERTSHTLTYLHATNERQRSMACGLLRAEKLTAADMTMVCQAIEAGPYRVLTELAARHADILPTQDALIIVLPRLEKEYWRVRVIEALVTRPDVDVAALVTEWPMATLWAAARARSHEHLQLIRPQLRALEADWHRLPIVAWALGRLGACEDLDQLERRMKRSAEWKRYWQTLRMSGGDGS